MGFSNMAIFALIPIFGILSNMVIILPPHLVSSKIIFIPIFDSLLKKTKDFLPRLGHIPLFLKIVGV
jgi:hypothetical protein